MMPRHCLGARRWPGSPSAADGSAMGGGGCAVPWLGRRAHGCDAGGVGPARCLGGGEDCFLCGCGPHRVGGASAAIRWQRSASVVLPLCTAPPFSMVWVHLPAGCWPISWSCCGRIWTGIWRSTTGCYMIMWLTSFGPCRWRRSSARRAPLRGRISRTAVAAAGAAAPAGRLLESDSASGAVVCNSARRRNGQRGRCRGNRP